MKSASLSLAVAAITLALGQPASAQSAAGTQVTAAPQAGEGTAGPACELHVFPTLEGQALTTGWLVGFGVVGAVADAASNRDRNVNETEYLKEALGPRLQVQALGSVDMIAALKLPPSKIVYEAPISDRNVTTKATKRLSSSTAACYSELIVTQNFYTKRAIYGRSLNNRFVFKDFRGGKPDAKLVKGRGGSGLTSFPPKTTDETEAAEKDLREAFSKNFLEFSNGVSATKS